MRLRSITSLGLTTSIGHDVVTACAAHRTGAMRFAPLKGVTAYDPEELEAPVIGAPVKGITDGFIQTGRWLAMARASLADLVRYGQLPGPAEDRAFWSGTALLWALPIIRHERFLWPETEVLELLEGSCGELLAKLAGVQTRRLPAAQAYACEGEVSLAVALQRLERMAASGQLERAVVIAVDSWLDKLSLGALARGQRLKTPERSSGLIPGESAACVLLETPSSAARRGRAPQAEVLGVRSARAPAQSGPEEARPGSAAGVGRRVAEAIAAVLADAQLRPPFDGDLLIDLNGEAWRAESWGYALVALRAWGWLGQTREVLPAKSLGDVGSATAGVCVCLAVRAFARGYAGGGRSVVVSVSDRGDASAILLGATSA